MYYMAYGRSSAASRATGFFQKTFQISRAGPKWTMLAPKTWAGRVPHRLVVTILEVCRAPSAFGRFPWFWGDLAGLLSAFWVAFWGVLGGLGVVLGVMLGPENLGKGVAPRGRRFHSRFKIDFVSERRSPRDPKICIELRNPNVKCISAF